MPEIKEEFCGACVAGVGALLGAGTTVASSKTQKKYKKTVFWSGLIVTILSILVLFYLLMNKKACKSCSSMEE